MDRKIRVLIAKPGLDGHDRGALVIAQALRDNGMEVIYTGLRQTPMQIARAALQEDVDVIGLSSLSGAHNTLFPKVIAALKELNADDIPVIGGGVIPSEDIPGLREAGIQKVFTSGSSTQSLANYIQELINTHAKLEPPKKISHIGIAVHRLDDALPFYTDTLGLSLEGVEEVSSENVKVAFLRIGETRFELLEPLSDSSSIQDFLDKRGEGVHHIALEVEEIDLRIKQLQAEGIRLINQEAKPGAHDTNIAFIHPSSANRVLYELCEPRGKERDA